MARMRYIKPEFWTDSRMVALTRDARLLYIGTWNFALCDKGHLEDDPLRLKMQIFPADDVDIPALLGELMAAKRIIRVTDGQCTWLQIVHLGAHQKVDPRWTPRCPACKTTANLSETQESLGGALTSANAATQAPETLLDENPSGTLLNSPQEGRGGEGIGERQTPSSPATPATVTQPGERIRAGLFDTFWAAYPRKVGKATARRAFDAAIRRTGNPTLVIDGARRLATDPNLPEREFIPHPPTWLNRDGWEDEALPPRTNGRPPERPRSGAGVWSQVLSGEPR
jgi:hypothetical protein